MEFGITTIGHNERLEPPEEFNDTLKDLFGVNIYGDPLYRIIWGQTETMRVSLKEGGYTDMTCGGNLAAWLLQKWTSPEKWGTPECFEIINKDPANGQLLFPYPEYGRYETVRNLGSGDLDYEIIDTIVPLLEQVLCLSVAELEAAQDRQKELDNERDLNRITDSFVDALPSRYGPVSYGRGGCKTSVLQKKAEQIQKIWNQVDPRKMRHIKGFYQGNAPTPAI